MKSKENPSEVVNSLIAQHIDLAHEAVGQCLRRNPFCEDEEEERGPLTLKALDVLFRCAEKYDPARGPFENYARRSLSMALWSIPRIVTFSDVGGFQESRILDECGDIDIEGEEWQVLDAAFRWLQAHDPPAAELIQLRKEEGKYTEMARQLGYSLATCWRRLKRAQEKVRTRFYEQGGTRDFRRGGRRNWGECMTDMSLVVYSENGVGPPGGRHWWWTRPLPPDKEDDATPRYIPRSSVWQTALAKTGRKKRSEKN